MGLFFGVNIVDVVFEMNEVIGFLLGLCVMGIEDDDIFEFIFFVMKDFFVFLNLCKVFEVDFEFMIV